MKKIFIAISIILIILSIGIYYNSTTVKLFESIDTESIDKISISYIGGTFSTEDKNQILEIMNYLKTLKFSKRSNNNVPNTTPDAMMGLVDKKGFAIIGLKFYGDVARLLPKEEDAYTIPEDLYDNLKNICKKYEK